MLLNWVEDFTLSKLTEACDIEKAKKIKNKNVF